MEANTPRNRKHEIQPFSNWRHFAAQKAVNHTTKGRLL